jgi:hypothetical protein
MAGADRSGLISAVYLYKLKGKSPREASWQLSPLYGHVPLINPATKAMDDSFWGYVNSERN